MCLPGMAQDKGKESHKQQMLAGPVKDFDMHICLKIHKSSQKCFIQRMTGLDLHF